MDGNPPTIGALRRQANSVAVVSIGVLFEYANQLANVRLSGVSLGYDLVLGLSSCVRVHPFVRGVCCNATQEPELPAYLAHTHTQREKPDTRNHPAPPRPVPSRPVPSHEF
jgi:hypothetical protein